VVALNFLRISILTIAGAEPMPRSAYTWDYQSLVLLDELSISKNTTYRLSDFCRKRVR
jgi:hypothetical protein